MIRANQIPDEVVEAAARAICAGNKWGEPCAEPCTDCVPEARAAIAAALNAWPDMAEQFFPNSPLRPPGIFLPLSQDARDE